MMLSCSPSKSAQRRRVGTRISGVRRTLAAPPSDLDGGSRGYGIGSQRPSARISKRAGRIDSRPPDRRVDDVRRGQNSGDRTNAHARTTGRSLCVIAIYLARHRRIVRTIHTVGRLHHDRHGYRHHALRHRHREDEGDNGQPRHEPADATQGHVSSIGMMMGPLKMVKPIDPGQRRKLDRLEAAPRSAPVDHLGLVEAVDRLDDGAGSRAVADTMLSRGRRHPLTIA